MTDRIEQMIQNICKVKSFAGGRAFNDCHGMSVIAYCSRDKDHFEEVSEFLKPLKRDWIISKTVRVSIKKVMILEMLMMAEAALRIVKQSRIRDDIRKDA